MSLIDSSSSGGQMGTGVGNYKGVMLCNRPFGGTSAASDNKPKASGEKQQFHCGKVPEIPGLAQPISIKEKFLRRPKKDSVLTKHKKWLADLQKTKEQLELQYLEEMKAKEDQQSRFQEKEKEMRKLSISMIRSESEEKSPSNNQSDEKLSYKYMMAESKGGASPNDAKAQSKSLASDKKQSQKPAWAMTEDTDEQRVRNLEQAEEDELLEFAEGLDYDKYIDDVEVQVMMEKLRKRIGDLEAEVKVEDQRESAAEERQAKREMLDLMGATEGALRGKTLSDATKEERQAMLAARALLQEDEEMQAVHSAKSVAKLLATAKDKIDEVRVSVESNDPNASHSVSPQVFNEPKVVVHDSSEGARLEGKTAVRNLPYMHRNPAV